MTTAADIDRIVDGPETKAARARALFDLGCDRSDVTELLNMSYSQAHSLWKERDGRQDAGLRRGSSRRSGLDGAIEQDGGEVEEGTSPTPSRRSLVLSPSQVRVATQDGHRVIKVDRDGSTECRQCGADLIYSIRWLAFVHKHSTSAPTNLEDYYE